MLNYGDTQVDEAKLPAASVHALLSRGLSHFLGNEQASKVTSRIRATLAAGKPDTYEATRDEIEAFRAANESQVNGWKSEVHGVAMKALAEGTIGVSTRGPAKDPMQSAMATIARKEVGELLKANNLAIPTGDKTVSFGGQELTMAILIERRIAKHGDRIKKVVERNMAEAARAAKKLTESESLSDLL